MTIRMAQIGLGHWGPNLFRNFYEHEDVALELVCDLDATKLEKVRQTGVRTTTDSAEVFASGVDAVVISTPVSTHEALARAALESDKHVFVEKPLARTAAACEALIELAAARERLLMVGHVFLYNAGIRYVRGLIERGDLGKLLFVHGRRINLGPIRHDVNALWDLASHDISILNYWLDSVPTAVSATGSCLLDPDIHDVVNASFTYPGNVGCYILASWLHPKKVRRLTVVGEHKTVIWDDVAPGEPIQIFDRSVSQTELQTELPEQVRGTLSEFQYLIHQGDKLVPHVPVGEPLRAECDHFVGCLLSGASPLSDGRNGLDVVRVLEAADRSLAQHSARVALAG